VTGVAFHPQAQIELAELTRYYENAANGLGAEFLDQVERSLSRLVDTPAFGHVVRAPVRRYLLGRFPVAIVYESIGDLVYVVAVMHLRRRLGYWRFRRASRRSS
jgi:toxin ParE1/3/4